MALAAHWQLADQVGTHCPTMGAELAAARLLEISAHTLKEAEEALHVGNWVRHALSPVSAGALRPPPAGFDVAVLERLLKGASTPLRSEACEFASHGVQYGPEEGFNEQEVVIMQGVGIGVDEFTNEVVVEPGIGGSLVWGSSSLALWSLVPSRDHAGRRH